MLTSPATRYPVMIDPSFNAVAPAPTDHWSSEPLLLIHGWSDTCAAAWHPDNDSLATDNADDYLADQGFGDVVRVGYYGYDTGCDSNLNAPTDPDPNDPNNLNLAAAYNKDTAGCDAIPLAYNEPSSNYGTTDDHIDRLACLLAWYIYDFYTHPADGLAPVAVKVVGEQVGCECEVGTLFACLCMLPGRNYLW